ncbi:cytochrome B [Solemya pervernicosa gill symbiont]|uniref:Cytochrome B n=2 Tax=Gammaproteobacteria incertae sedis TaxID=118884 RepID=A0A1T2L4R4_9GAMM|nr:cytochrome b/b6 domain-containing protein [Candidatus Reidiella endopervernicosa]OOZ40052.1 cytochrome B [Solemya pervernicosa gill symbiont]QKQ27629.1 cytochrome b/b6 domain-containing protein [Candidatus Reidiella endopervernicosa]
MDNEIKVWDPLVRIFHWTLVAAFVIAYVTEDELLTLHVWAGYYVAALLVFRVFWGLIGPRYARFKDFIYAPTTIIAYLKDMSGNRARRYLGHNPAAGAMVVALLLMLTGTTLTGLQLYAVEKGAGPLAQVEGFTLISTAHADDDEDEEEHEGDEGEGDEFWEELHETFANLTLMLVLLHIVGVVVSSLAHNENLPRAMVTGRKRSEE